MHKTPCLLVLFLAFALSGGTAENPSSAAVADVEGNYADLADSYGIISTIDSGLFATYQSKDRTAWERVYSEKRKQVSEKLSHISASRLSPLDGRAVDAMKRHLRDDFPEQFNDQNAPPEHCRDAQRHDLSLTSLEGALHSCFTELGNNLEFESKKVTRVSALGMLEEMNEEERRKKLFYAFDSLWHAIDGNHDSGSPYRRLIPLVVSAADGHGTWVDAAAKTIGVSSTEVERWLEQILDTWRQVDGGQMVEPWNYFYRGGEAARLLSAATPNNSFVPVNQRYYRDLGADLQQLGVLYDLEARPGKAPLAYTDFVTRGRLLDGKWRPSVVHISGSYATGGLGLLNELVHENGHAVYLMAIHVRPAFMDVSAELFDEAFADVPSWNTYEPAWQRKYLGQAASDSASQRTLFSSVMLDVAWALFECRMLRTPGSDPNELWTDITNHYLHIVRHPEISWWALRGQLVQMPGYMVNYGLGSVLTADIRQHTRTALGAFETGNPQWYSWTSERLLRYGEELDTSTLLKQFLGRPVSPAALLDQIRRVGQN
ncbi:MAG: hypothetical protein JOZ80_01265 [Acidobacteriaceae bacterium]|nr:hypothetical protein [Acidobacteriaceae bacterium]